MKNIIIGTAGHIDHGKTTLIKYLTGIDTDRLPQEKEREMTIDIGFSYIRENDINIGIVDVPGHQKFIKNMLSGVSGINYVLFLIASDDGIMPQTVEHFEILKLLGIKSGMIILTKTDLVTKEKISELKSQIKERFKGSFLENFDILETSTKDIESFDRLKIKLLEDISKLDLENQNKDFLMYIDRSFTIKGVGAVVTGSVSSGKVNLGDNIYLYPARKKLKIKSIENFGNKLETLEENCRGALNLGGIDYKEIKRGDFLYSDDSLISSDRIDIFLTFLENKLIKNNQRIRIYLGTDEVIGKILLFDKYKNGYIGQVVLEKEVFSFKNQLGIIRSYSPIVTLGGIKILDTKGQKISKRNNNYENYIGRLKDIFDNKDFDKKDKESLKEKLIEQLKTFHTDNPLKKGIKPLELEKILSTDIGDILEDLSKENLIKIENNTVSLYDFKVKLTKEQKDLKEKIFKIYKNSGFYMVKYEIIENMLGDFYPKKEIEKIHRFMVENQMIVYLEEDRYILSGFFKEAQKRLIDYFSQEENRKNGITLGGFRELLDTNRQSAISIINKLEKIKFLINRENTRFLREGF